MKESAKASRRHRRRGERGLAIVMTGLMLIPLMIFAAMGVDLAAWYARISDIQRAADAAALAGAVWMPDLGRATTEANASLRSNGFVNGVDDISITITQGSTSTSVRVTVTDNDVDRYFSSVFRDGPASITRYAEAEYNLPLPLGSPLNYFGGDRSTVPDPAPNYAYTVQWPSDYTTRTPTDATVANALDCHVTSNSNLTGRWAGTPSTYRATEYGSGSVCGWGVGRTNATGTSAFPPPDYWQRPPTNPSCRIREDGSSSGTVLGRWNTGSPPTFSTSTSGSEAACTWTNSTTNSSLFTSHPSGSTAVRTIAPQNRPCLVGYTAADGHWASTGVWTTGLPGFAGGTEASGNRLCTWSAQFTDTTVTPPNPILTTRNPGFWAMIYGPGQYAANGDAFSTRCTSQFNCGSVQNLSYRPSTDANRGEWYVVDIPSGASGTVDIRVFDASFHQDWSSDYDEGGNPNFQTEFRVFEQTNELDFNVRTQLGSSPSANPSNGGCWWQLEQESGFFHNWATLCSITGAQAGDRYLVNVRTNSVGAATENGNNAYAIEAVLNGDRDANPGPSIYAYRDMVINNNNQCSSGTCDGVFYLAKVDPNYAGRTLVIEMYDAGDSTGAGLSTVYPMMPSPTMPRPVVNVPAADCSFTATADPNPNINTSDLRIHTGSRRVPDPTPPDSGDGNCGIRATVSGVRQFNGEWLRIRVQIPYDYTCDRTVNRPESTANSCWWGIRYRFNGNASDTTTWQARVEGNPLQLTQ
jgi:hypothetical protein